MSDMDDAGSDESPAPDTDPPVPDRRNTIDLVRVERGEPERRSLRRPVNPEAREPSEVPEEE